MGSRAACLLLLLLVIGSGAAGSARAQGCSQCRDSVSQTNPAVQRSYRDAIGLMIGAVVAMSTAMAVVMRRMR